MDWLESCQYERKSGKKVATFPLHLARKLPMCRCFGSGSGKPG